jgi:serine protease inhibitor
LGDLAALGFTSNNFPRFSAQPDQLLIDMIIHQAVLELNEEGAEAAAATAVMVKRSSMAAGQNRSAWSWIGPFSALFRITKAGRRCSWGLFMIRRGDGRRLWYN